VRKAIWIMLGLLILGTGPAGAGELDGLLPQSGEVGGWTTFQWPQDEDDLFWLIDGAGQVYIDLGFQEAVFQNYYDADFIALNLEIYDQGTSANAESTYHHPSLEIGWEVPQEGFGVEGRVDTMALGSYRAEFWRDRYFVRGTILEKSAYTWQILTSFCQLVDQKLIGKTVIDGLPADGEIPGWTCYLAADDSLGIETLLESEANLFFEWGCSAGLRQSYYDSQFVLLQLELFDQETAVNAQSLYHDHRLETGLEVARNDFGQEGRLDTTSSWTYSAQFWRDRYLARLLVQEKTDAALTDLLAFCQLVDQKILSTGLPESDAESFHPPVRSLMAFPNPFNAEVTIRYRIPQDTPSRSGYRLDIFNIRGQRVAALTEGSILPPGEYEARWGGRDDDNRPVASGVYFCRLRYGRHIRIVRLILSR